ncbi:MAG: tyrosine phenol-lyase, partial [Deltaproteobacteria bacterium]|nr:tyrosine phenol-lyase [Deltaproteobacteria bacterium]
VLMSAKKDAFGNIGGFLALKSKELAEAVRTKMVLTEGFPTYGGLAGRDMEALAVGLKEILEEDYLKYRIRSTAYLGEGLEAAGFKIVKPVGGHAVYLDAGACLPHLPPQQLPGQSLAVAFYEAIGIRSVEVGTAMLGGLDPVTGKEHTAPKELLRLAIPRRVYTQSHIDYIIELAHHFSPILPKLPGYEFAYQAPFLRHFTARYRRIMR